jgi:hypothetical protein
MIRIIGAPSLKRIIHGFFAASFLPGTKDFQAAMSKHISVCIILSTGPSGAGWAIDSFPGEEYSLDLDLNIFHPKPSRSG